jgi:death on curing protein
VSPRFLSVEEVLAIHRFVSARYSDVAEPVSGSGVRDLGLLESAVMSCQASFGGEYLYKGLPDMAGALWHSIVVNHPFVDANKRVGLAATSTFLRLHGLRLTLSEDEAVRVTLGIAAGTIGRDATLQAVQDNCERP